VKILDVLFMNRSRAVMLIDLMLGGGGAPWTSKFENQVRLTGAITCERMSIGICIRSPPLLTALSGRRPVP